MPKVSTFRSLDRWGEIVRLIIVPLLIQALF